MSCGSDTLVSRIVAIALTLMTTVALAGIASGETGASYTATSDNPDNHVSALLVQPPASHAAPTSTSGGAVNLSWTATPTAPGAGHTLAYLVLRGPAGGPYATVATVPGLSHVDTPPSDGTYEYVIKARVTGGGAFDSASSAARSGVSDRTAPTPVTALSSGRGANGNPVTVDLSWVAGSDALSGVRGYEVRWTAPVSRCPAPTTTSYPNVATIGAVTAYQIGGLVAGSSYCAYLVTLDNAGNRSADSAVTGPRSAR